MVERTNIVCSGIGSAPTAMPLLLALGQPARDCWNGRPRTHDVIEIIKQSLHF